MKFGGNKYYTQCTITGKKRKEFMHNMHKLATNMTFTHMTPKKGIKKHGERAVDAMYKEYTQL